MADTDNLPVVCHATYEDDSDQSQTRPTDNLSAAKDEDEEEAAVQTSPEMMMDGREIDWKKTGAIPKRKAYLGDQGNKSLPGVSVSPREGKHSLTNASRNSTGPPQLPSTSNSNAILKTLNDYGTGEAVDRSAIFGTKDHKGKDHVYYGGPDEIRSLAERIYTRKSRGSQDGVILTDMTEKLHIQDGNYREGHEYETGEELGKGQRSTVCTISDRGNFFARKSVLLEDFNPDEAVIWCCLFHANIPKLLGLVRTDFIVLFFSEYEPCENLQTYVDKHHLPLGQGEALEIFQQVFDALSYLHSRRIIHRDVYPSNILVNEQAKLLDFGIAVKLTDSFYTEGETDGMGNPAYRAPEIERGKPYDERVDVWSANCSLMFSLTGHAPWTDSKKDSSEADIPKSTNQIVKEVVEFAHNEDLTRRPCSKDVLRKYKSISRHKVRELVRNPPDSSEDSGGSYQSQFGSDDRFDGLAHAPTDDLPQDHVVNDPQHNIADGNEQPHNVKGIFVTVKDSKRKEDLKIKLPNEYSVIWVAGALYDEIETAPFTLHDEDQGALERKHSFGRGNHTLVAVLAPDGDDWKWRMHKDGKVEYSKE